MKTQEILVVEDDPEIAELLEYNLSANGFSVLTANTGLAACQRIGVKRPDLILLDLMLPDFDGWEICKMIRGHGDEAISGLPIIILSAMATSADKVKGLELGADDYIAKPFSIEELLARVRKLLKPRKSRSKGSGRNSKEEGDGFLDFQDMVFHELANQLVIVRGFSDKLQRHGEILPQDKVRSYAEAIYKSSEHLGSLAEEMLILRRLQEERIEVVKHDIHLREMAAGLADLLNSAASAKGISFMVEIPPGFPILRLNQPSLKIALSCLLDNAVKYGRPGGRVLLTCAVLPDSSTAIYVEDDGPGLPRGEEELVFEKFHRGSNVEAATKGTGLGLFFAKTLTEALGGSISVNSDPSRGCRFRLLFPAGVKSEAA